MFDKLFEPFQLGPMKLKNRLILSGINVNYAAEDGSVTLRLKNFYAERAKGGVGMVQTGICYVDPGGKFFTHQMGIHNDAIVPGLRDMIEEIHSYGAAAVVQLCHVGRYASSKVLGGQSSVAPSPLPSRVTHEVPRELTVPEIKAIIEAFAQGARRAREAGADAVDLAGAVGYLISQFLSPHSNRRNDEYGGDLERRMRFVLEIIARIKEVAGPDYPIMYRISGDEFMEGGNKLEDVKVIAQELEKAGIVSLNVIPGWHDCPVPLVSYHVSPGHFVYLAEEVKKVLRIPVIASNRINTPQLAEEILAAGRADLVTMARALIADPELPNKAAAGRLEDIRPCIACNQGCYDRLFSNLDIQCMVNPAAGREGEFRLEPAAKPRKVAVIGGGPAGMEAAIVAAQRGHYVTLYEKSDSLGGQLRLAAVPPGKGEIGNLVTYLSTQVEKAGVQVVKGASVSLGALQAARPEVIILATGAKPTIPSIPGVEGDNVTLAHDVLAGRAKVGGDRVIVVGGGQVGIETGEFLAEQGKRVTIVEMLDKIGADLGVTVRWIVLGGLRQRGIVTLTNAKVQEVTKRGVAIERDGAREVVEGDAVVIAVGSQPERPSLGDLESRVEVCIVGDCVKPRKALEAIYEGASVALRI